MKTITILYCIWTNADGCGVQIEGAYENKATAESMRDTLQKSAEKWNAAHPECTEHYEVETVIVNDA